MTSEWAQQGSNLRPNGYASHYGFRRPFRVCGLDCPFTLAYTTGLSSSPYTFLLPGLVRDHQLTGFPDFRKYLSLIHI